MPGEFIVDKTANSAFWGTDLAAILAAHRIDSLIFAGVTTDVCVHCTLREANDRGFECLLAGDACGSGDAAAHRAALHMVTVEDGVFGAVADVAQIADALVRLPQDIARPTDLPPIPPAIQLVTPAAPPAPPEDPFLGDWSI
jgi:nicotinamidase-related amidase